eukprot:567224_1
MNGNCLSVKRLHHMTRGTTDVKRLADFYNQVMGFKPIETPNLPFNVSWSQLGDIQLHIIERKDGYVMPEDPFNNNGKKRSGPVALTRGHHTAFMTDNFEETKRKLTALGITFKEGGPLRALPKQSTLKQLWFFDPDGNGIEILQSHQKIQSKL